MSNQKINEEHLKHNEQVFNEVFEEMKNSSIEDLVRYIIGLSQESQQHTYTNIVLGSLIDGISQLLIEKNIIDLEEFKEISAQNLKIAEKQYNSLMNQEQFEEQSENENSDEK